MSITNVCGAPVHLRSVSDVMEAALSLPVNRVCQWNARAMETDESNGILVLALGPFVALRVVTVSRGQTVAERSGGF